MNRVNPPEQLKLPSIKEVGLIRFLNDLKFIVFQLWKRTGAGDDWIDDNRSGLYEFDDLVNNTAKDQLLSDVVSTTVNYTTIGDQVIICTSDLTVTLNDKPDDQERVKVIVANGDVTVSGNGKLINKETDQIVIFKNLVTTGTLDIIYIIELDEWFIV